MRLHFFKARTPQSGKAPEPVVSQESAPVPESLEGLLRSPEVRRTVVQDRRGLLPALLLLQKHLECIRVREWQRAQQRMQVLSAPQQMAVEAITREIVNAVLLAPISAMAVAKEDERQTMLECLTAMFKLEQFSAHPEPKSIHSDRANENERRARAV